MRRFQSTVLTLALLAAGAASAAPPSVNVSGRLVDAAGQPPPDTSTGTLAFLFGYYDGAGAWTQVGEFFSLDNKVRLTQGYFSVSVPLPGRDLFTVRPTTLRLRFTDWIDIPLTTVPYALQAERAPVVVQVPLSDLTVGSASCVDWFVTTNGNEFGIRTLAFLDPKDGGCASDGSSSALALAGAVLLPQWRPTEAIVRLKVANVGTTSTPPPVALRLTWGIRSESKTQPACYPTTADFPVLKDNSGGANLALGESLARTVSTRLSFTNCLYSATTAAPYYGGDSLRFRLQRVDTGPAFPFEIEAMTVEFR